MSELSESDLESCTAGKSSGPRPTAAITPARPIPLILPWQETPTPITAIARTPEPIPSIRQGGGCSGGSCTRAA